MRNTLLESSLILTLLYLVAMQPLTAQQSLTKDFVDPYSTSSCFITEYNSRHKPIFSATGFITKINSDYYLITNNHVVGGKYAKDDYVKRYNRKIPSDSLPTLLTVRVYNRYLAQASDIWLHINDKNAAGWIPFYENDKDTTSLLDIAAVPIIAHPESDFANITILGPNNMRPDILVYPGSDLYIVGFPHGQAQLLVYPIWKRGVVASEVNLMDLGISTFLIDATTRPGMSGSPVFYRDKFVMTGGGSMEMNGIQTYLIGIYSAQDSADEIGVVTKLDKVFTKLSQLNQR